MKPKGKFAWTVTIGTKGQIVIPKEAREMFGFRPGDTLLLLGDEKRGIALPPKSAYTTLFTRVFDQEMKKEAEEELK
ncbi:MAG: AbrB/MazE/SpoVT family DNA-binding domain-containing protein [Oscillospiraceae bacterium]|nr:AbrB/MazE/SpoVT family DNA-binding domain-containing protein [Oscillospiraceae bacterium]